MLRADAALPSDACANGTTPAAPDLARLVIARALGLRLVVLVLGSATAAFAVATTADVAVSGTPTLADAAVRRFDLTILWMSVALAGARIALSFELDEREKWLDSFVAAGASRRRYVGGIGVAAFAAAALIFIAAAASFALGLLLLHGTGELVRPLPHTAGIGLVALAHWCAWFTLIGLVTRRALPALALGIATASVPTLLMFIQLKQTGAISEGVLRAMLLFPPLVWGGSVEALLLQLVAISLISALALGCADRLAGRHT